MRSASIDSSLLLALGVGSTVRAEPVPRQSARARKNAGLVSEETRGKCTIYAIDREAVAAALVAFHSMLRA